MKKYLILILAIATFSAKAQTSNFTGTWKRNDAKTDPGGLSLNTVAKQLDISSDSKALYIKSTLGNAAGETHTSIDTLNLDGTEHVLNYSSQRKKRTSLAWSADKKQLTTTITVLDPQGTIVQNWHQVWSINADKSLDIKLELAYNEDNFQLNETFDKQ